jgi:hypothetical protein
MGKVKKIRNLFVASIVMASVAAYASLFLGKNVNEVYFLGIIISVVFIILGLAARSKSIYYKKLQEIRENYGKENKRERKFEDIKLLFDVLKYKTPGEIYVDDQTYLDLNMNEVFGKVDKTVSSP